MAHVFAVLLCVYTIWIAQPGTSLFSWHPTLMVIGFCLFMFEAILVFSPVSSVVERYKHEWKVRLHWILQVAAAVCIALGFLAVFQTKVQNNKSHFTTYHGWFGLGTIILLAMQNAFGIGLLFWNVKMFNPFSVNLALRKQMHALFGLLVFMMACVTIVLSLYSTFVEKNAGELAWYGMLSLTTVLASVVANQVNNEYIFKRK